MATAAKKKKHTTTARKTTTAHKRSTPKKAAKKKTAPKKWSHQVMETSDALDLQSGIFKSKDPKKIQVH